MCCGRSRIRAHSEVVWSKAGVALSTLEAAHLDANDKINRVNEIIQTLPGGMLYDPNSLIETSEGTKISYKKLHTSLTAIRSATDDELK
jgi:hypothetical protein